MASDTVITAVLGTISDNPAEVSSPDAYIEAHPIEYWELTRYETQTSTYCFGRFDGL